MFFRIIVRCGGTNFLEEVLIKTQLSQLAEEGIKIRGESESVYELAMHVSLNVAQYLFEGFDFGTGAKSVC